MNKARVALTTSFIMFSFSGAYAQDNNLVLAAPPPQVSSGGADGRQNAGFAGYVPSASPSGMGSINSSSQNIPATKVEAGMTLSDGHVTNPEKVEGFNKAIEQNFPMTPEMLRQYRSIYEEQQRIILERPEPTITMDNVLMSLEPGEKPPLVYLAPGISTVIGIYDSSGQAWPITDIVIGDGKAFQMIQLGQKGNNLAITPLNPIGFTNLIISLEGEPKPVMIRIGVSASVAHYKRDIQIMKPGPNAVINTVTEMPEIKRINMPETTPIEKEAGDPVLAMALSGVDMPETAEPVSVGGVKAKAWVLGDTMIIRTKSPLLNPAWSGSLAGPDGILVYRVPKVSTLSFSVNGVPTIASVDIP